MKTALPLLDITASAHRDTLHRLLLLDLKVAESTDRDEAPARIALVIDRSGSMGGAPIRIATEAAARFIRSLSSNDRVAVIAYDDGVDVISPLSRPSEAIAAATERIEVRGSTALYSGWLAGAKAVGPGGRVILLSDGHANVGKYTHASDLGRHAGLSYEKYRVVTSTIGVGEGYDEALMGAMAREGKGSHYYAATLDALVESLSQERYAVSQAALNFVTLRVGDQTHSVGNLWRGEEQQLVMPLPDLETPVTIRMTDVATGDRRTHAIALPTSWATVPEATLRLLFDRAAVIEAEVARDVHSSAAASRAASALREVLFALMGHELADTPTAVAERRRIESAVERLNRLSQRYDEGEATVHRKRAMQASYNLLKPDQAYAALDEDRAALFLRPSSEPGYSVESSIFDRLSHEDWRRLGRVPVSLSGNVVRLACVNPRDGFAAKDLSARLPEFRFVTEKAPITREELDELLATTVR